MCDNLREFQIELLLLTHVCYFPYNNGGGGNFSPLGQNNVAVGREAQNIQDEAKKPPLISIAA